MLLFLVVQVHAAVPAELVTPDLQVKPISLQSLHGSAISFFGADRSYRREDTSRHLQLRMTGVEPSAAGQDLLLLADGQRFAGKWVGGANEGQSIRWSHLVFGEMTFDLDSVAGWQLAGAAEAASGGGRGEEDRVILMNGDIVSGFVVAVTDDSVSVQVQSAGKAQALPVERTRISRVTLAHPTALPPAERMLVVHLVDGTRASVMDLSIEDETLALRRSAAVEPVKAPLAQLLRVDFAARGVTLHDLTALPMTVTGGGEVFGVQIQPRIRGTMLVLHAPVDVQFALPAGAQRFAATAELDLDAQDPIDWASIEMAVLVGEREAARYTLTAGQRRVAINVPLEGAETVSLRLLPGVNGPVLDRLRLRDAVVLVRTPEPAKTPATAPAP